MTAPRRPEPPVIIRCEQRSIVAKWYPGCPGSAHKYRLQARLVEGLDGIGAMHNNKSVLAMTDNNRASTARGRGTGGNRRSAWGGIEGGSGGSRAGGEWVTVYEGVDSTAKVGKRGDQAQKEGPTLHDTRCAQCRSLIAFFSARCCANNTM